MGKPSRATIAYCRKQAESVLQVYSLIEKQKAKVATEEEELARLQNRVKGADNLVREETGYGILDLYDLVTEEITQGDKTTHKKSFKMKYPDTLVPPTKEGQDDDNSNSDSESNSQI